MNRKIHCPKCGFDLSAVFGKRKQVIYCNRGATLVADHIKCACGIYVRYNYAKIEFTPENSVMIETPWDDSVEGFIK